MKSLIHLDTNIWIEFFFNPREEIIDLVNTNSISVSGYCLAEIAEILICHKINPKDGLDFISAKAKIVPITPQIAIDAAKVKITQRKKNSKFGLADAIHYSSAISINATFITLDNDFQGLDNVRIL